MGGVTELGDDIISPDLSSEDAARLSARLADIQAALRREQGAFIRDEIAAVRDDATRWLSDDVREPITHQLDRAAQHVSGDDGGTPEIGHAELETARTLLIRAMSTRLDDAVAGNAPPSGMDAGAWAQLRGEIRATLAAVPAQPLSPQRRPPTDACSRRFRHDPGVHRAHRAPSPDDADKERAAVLDSILTHLNTARSALERDDLAGAHAAYDEARSETAASVPAALALAARGRAFPPAAPKQPVVGTVAAPTFDVLPFPTRVRLRGSSGGTSGSSSASPSCSASPSACLHSTTASPNGVARETSSSLFSGASDSRGSRTRFRDTSAFARL
jgi:hypothetical protein